MLELKFEDLSLDSLNAPPASKWNPPFDPKDLFAAARAIQEKTGHDSQYIMERKVAEARANARKQVLVDANETTLQIDLDSEEAYSKFVADGLPSLLRFTNVDVAIPNLRVKKVLVTRSRSFTTKGSMHAYIHVSRALSIPERIALQAVLGSDLTRELLNIMAYLGGLTNGVMLFENKDAVPEVIFDAEPKQATELASVLLSDKEDSKIEH